MRGPAAAQRVDPKRPDPKVLTQAAGVLKKGGVVLFPTDTVYGLGVIQGVSQAVGRLSEIKGSDPQKLLTVHLSSVLHIRPLVSEITEQAEALIREFLPGPLTVILKGKFQPTLGIRVPSDEVSRSLIEAVGRPLLATSANTSGVDAPTDPKKIQPQILDSVDFFLDSGPTVHGGPSTVVDLSRDPPKILRVGVIQKKALNRILGNLVMMNERGTQKAQSLLFVCTGNSCRSPMAAAYVERRLKELGERGVRVWSRGVSPMVGMGATQEAILVMKEEGLDVSGHKAKNLTDDEIRQADIIFCMEEFHREVILARVPDVRDRVRVMHVEDPIGEPVNVYRDCLKKIKASIEKSKDVL